MNIYGSIDKTEPQDDGTLKVWGYASSEVLDSAGEIITAEAMKAAIPDYMAFGAVREMHSANKAAGTAIEIEVQDDGRTYFGAHVVDTEAVRKVQHGVYKGFSIGGKVLSRDELQKSTITGLKLTEISLVDRPANPEARFTMFKSDGAEEHDLTKYAGEEVFDVGIALRMLDDAYWLLGMEQDEVGDYPEQVTALKRAIAALKEFIISEIQENGDKEPVAGSAKSTDLEKLEEVASLLKSISPISAREEGEAINGEQLRKLGDLQQSLNDLQKRHDELESEAAELRRANESIMKAAGAAGADDDADPAEFIKQQSETIQKLEAMPEAPKAVLKAVGKTEDGGGSDADNAEEVVKNADGSVNELASELKKIHRTGGYVSR